MSSFVYVNFICSKGYHSKGMNDNILSLIKLHRYNFEYQFRVPPSTKNFFNIYIFVLSLEQFIFVYIEFKLGTHESVGES